MKWRELEALQQRPLDDKIAEARRVIAEAFAVAECPALAFSGGGVVGKHRSAHGRGNVTNPGQSRLRRLAGAWRLE